MGKEKLISGSSGILSRSKRRLLFSWVILISLIIGLTLQACGSALETEPAEAIVEEMTSSESSDPDPPDWCNADGYLYDLLPQIDSDAEGITVELCIPGGEGYSIETFDEVPEDLDDTKTLPTPFNINSFIAYFKVKNADVVVTSFDPPMLMRITYSYDAWQAIIERDFDAPRIAYLPWAGDAWAGEWVEFEVDEENIHPPAGTGTEGYIDIYIDGLPDPLIGDC